MVLFWFIAFAVNVLLGEIENGFVHTSEDPKIINIAVIEQNQANALFRKFTQARHIPYRFPLDGCYARATAMAQIAEEEGIEMGKVYAEGFLQAKTDLPKFPTVVWGWHVAPIAYVKKPDGKIEIMVFDPSLFRQPVTVEEWKLRMLDNSNGITPEILKLYYGSRFQYYTRDIESYKARWDKADLKGTKKTMETYFPLQDMSEARAAPSSQRQAEGVQ